MKAEESKITDILTEDKKYIIPAYQRPYSWSHEQVEDLIKDIYESFEEKTQEYFIGSLICIDKGNDIYEVVDGQQRLTTLSLILAKIRDLIQNTRVKGNLQKRVLPIDDFSEKPQEPRLQVRKKEEDLYKNYILQGDKQYLPDEKDRTHTEKLFINNFHVLEGYLVDFAEETLCQLAEYVLKNVYVVLVKTDSFASSYRLFNVLNTRGLSLKQSDLLKNRLFEIAENKKNISEKVEEYWEEIEDLIGIENMDKFLVLHETARKKNRNKAVLVFKLAEHFSDSVEKEYNGDVIQFVRTLKKSAENYQKIKEIDFDNEIVHRIIQSLTILYEEWIPPMLAFLNKLEQNDNKVSHQDFIEFVKLFEKCYLHRWFAKHNKSQREVVCYDAVANINNNATFDEIQKELKKHAKNEGFIEYVNSNIYEPRSNRMQLVKYVLRRIDQEMQDVSVSKKYNGTITIEHILPQNMENLYWKDRFTNDEHEQWVNKLGNLTLISGSKNSKAQNDGFDKKLDIYKNSDKKVSFDLAKDVLEYSEWNLENLRKRHEHLVEIAENIWLV
ncbi:MAG: DUF262 domain-containing HNH endonuclease family protein [Methylococcales bacterium]|nr:DUF262 domain-containing HNH endonuclease family protein [Methylococcales bacterium]